MESTNLLIFVMQKFREIKECFETSASFLFWENFVKSKKSFKLKLPFNCSAKKNKNKNFVTPKQRILLNLSLFFVVLQKFREITSHKKFTLIHISQIFCESNLTKNCVKSKNAMNILFSSAKNS